MGLRTYFEQIQEIEQTIDTPYVTIVSEATSDGGRAGVMSEVSRSVAARLVVEGRARIASPSEAEEYRIRCERAIQPLTEARTTSEGQDLRKPDASNRAIRNQNRSKG